MTDKNKIYVAFNAEGGELTSDMRYYNLMRAWKENEDHKFDFIDAHDLNDLMATSTEETIRSKLRERLNQTKTFVLLVGNETKSQHKFVRWEIKEAMERDIPIIVINLNKLKKQDETLCPPIIKDKLALHVGFYQKIIYKALKEWNKSHQNHREKGEDSSYHYKEEVYTRLIGNE